MPTYSFDHWEVNGVTYTSIPLSITVTADTTIMALYIEKGVTPPTAGPNYIPIVIAVSLAASVGMLFLLTRRKK